MANSRDLSGGINAIEPRPVCRVGRKAIDGKPELVLTVCFDRIGIELFRRIVLPRLLGPGFFIPSGLTLPVATTLRLEILLRDQLEPVAGAAVVLRHAQPGGQRGMVLRYSALEPRSLLRMRSIAAAAPASPPPATSAPAAPLAPLPPPQLSRQPGAVPRAIAAGPAALPARPPGRWPGDGQPPGGR